MKNETNQTVLFILKVYTKKELREIYKVSESTFKRWMRRIPEVTLSGKKNYLSVDQVKAILKIHGVPGEREFE